MILHFNRERRLAVLLFPVLLNACATFEASETKLKRIKTVGIVSAVGNELNFTRSGLNGTDGGDQHFPIGSWALDDMIVRQAGASIGTRFQVQPVNYDHASFYALSEKDSSIRPLNLMRNDPLKQLLHTHVSPQSLDAYVVIVKAKSTIGASGRSVEGMGTVSYGAIFGSYDQIHALYEIKVYDGHTFDLLEERQAAPLDNVDITRLAGPSHIVDATYMPSAGDPAQNEKLKLAFTEMIERSLQPTLRDLYLADLQ